MFALLSTKESMSLTKFQSKNRNRKVKTLPTPEHT